MRIVVKLIKGKDDNARGAIVRVPKSNSLTTRSICNLYHIESLKERSDEIVTFGCHYRTQSGALIFKKKYFH